MRGKYRTIVADPPWSYGRDEKRWASSRSSRKTNPTGSGHLEHIAMPYETMASQAIEALPIGNLADDDSILFLWATSRHLPDAFGVLAAWGFDYRQTLVWRKTGNPSPFGGSVAPQHAEFVLVGRRGKPDVGRLASSVFEAPAPQVGQHSAKPDAFLDLVEQISPEPRVELFARRARFGWDYAGDESLGTVEVEGLAS